MTASWYVCIGEDHQPFATQDPHGDVASTHGFRWQAQAEVDLILMARAANHRPARLPTTGDST